MDLGDMRDVSKYNKGYTFFLLLVNMFSRQIYVEPLKNKNKGTVLDAFKKMLKKNKLKFNNYQTDRGKFSIKKLTKLIHYCD